MEDSVDGESEAQRRWRPSMVIMEDSGDGIGERGVSEGDDGGIMMPSANSCARASVLFAQP